MSVETTIALGKLQEELFLLKEIIRIYLFEREGIGETGDEAVNELLTLYARKIMDESS